MGPRASSSRTAKAVRISPEASEKRLRETSLLCKLLERRRRSSDPSGGLETVLAFSSVFVFDNGKIGKTVEFPEDFPEEVAIPCPFESDCGVISVFPRLLARIERVSEDFFLPPELLWKICEFVDQREFYESLRLVNIDFFNLSWDESFCREMLQRVSETRFNRCLQEATNEERDGSHACFSDALYSEYVDSVLWFANKQFHKKLSISEHGRTNTGESLLMFGLMDGRLKFYFRMGLTIARASGDMNWGMNEWETRTFFHSMTGSCQIVPSEQATEEDTQKLILVIEDFWMIGRIKMSDYPFFSEKCIDELLFFQLSTSELVEGDRRFFVECNHEKGAIRFNLDSPPFKFMYYDGWKVNQECLGIWRVVSEEGRSYDPYDGW